MWGFVVGLIVWLIGAAGAWGQFAPEEGEYFESFERGLPPYVQAMRPDSLHISASHSKHGRHSLRWDWRAGEALLIRHGIGDVQRRGGLNQSCRASFSVWLYLEQPQAGALVFEFRAGETVTGAFRFPLQFVGWRQGRPFYDAFPSGQPTAAVDNIRLVAPTEAPAGTVFIDFLKYNTLTYPGRAILPEQEALWRRPQPDEQRFPQPAALTEAERAGLRKLLGPAEGPGIEEARVQALLAQFQKLGLERDERGFWRQGPPLDRHYQYCAHAGEHGAKESTYWPDEHGPGWEGMQTPGALAALANQIARAYRASNDASQRQRLAEAFLALEDYLYDQGLQAGSGFHWNWWIGASWAEAVLLMREPLAEAEQAFRATSAQAAWTPPQALTQNLPAGAGQALAGPLQRQCDYYLWNYGGADLFADKAPPSHMDYYHLSVRPLLNACLLQPEPAEQVRWLRAFQQLLERSITQPTSAFKPDGCAYHHGGHYFAYARNAFTTLPQIMLELSDTPWRLSPEAHERVRRAVLAQRIYCQTVDLPLSLSGRRPFSPFQRIDPRGLDLLARCGTPDGAQKIDPEVAAAYLRFVPQDAEKEPYKSAGIKPEAPPQGTFVMPYAALLCHRQQDWLASVHGQSKYVWGTEREGNVNCFGLFQGWGHLEILSGGSPVNAQDSGRQEAGWDWRHYEGTTAPELPLDIIDKQWTTALSPEAFANGLSHRGEQGLFAMILHQPLPGGKRLTGRKSWLFSGERILCLGSDISCEEAQYPTYTTLCQKGLRKDAQGRYPPTILDGAPLTGFPEERVLEEGRAHWLLDVQNTGYYVPAGQKIYLARRSQKSRDYANLGATEGDFLVAFLDHGRAPQGARYVYLLVVRATPEKMQRFAAQPPYQILQQDAAAHIVWDAVRQCWAGAFFVPQTVAAYAVGAHTFPVSRVESPCLIMAEEGPQGQLYLSLADPDLHLDNKGISQPQPVRVALRGAWRLQETTGRLCAWELPEARPVGRVLSSRPQETILEIVGQHGASYQLQLQRL